MTSPALAGEADGDETLALLRASIERYTSEHYDFEHRAVALRSDCAYSVRAWSDYANFGWLALRLPEAAGGLAASAAVTASLMEGVGARLLLEPILASAIVGTGLILRRANPGQLAELLPRLADGSMKLAFAHQESLDACGSQTIACEYRGGVLHGYKCTVLHGDCADRLIVSARNAGAAGLQSLYLVDATAAGLERKSYRLLDGRGAAALQFNAVRAQPLNAAAAAGADEAALATAQDEAAVALCSEALGAIRALNAATTRYLQSRQQFGRPLGANQALQHRMVEMYILEQEVRALGLAAQAALDAADATRTRLISAARAFACQAARTVAAEAVQMHGGMGVSDELDISHYYRRLMVIGTLFGNREFHFRRFADASGSWQ